MAHLEPEVRIKLIDISKEWAEKVANHTGPGTIPKAYPKEFDNIYKQLAKTVSEVMLEG